MNGIVRSEFIDLLDILETAENIEKLRQAISTNRIVPYHYITIGECGCLYGTSEAIFTGWPEDPLDPIERMGFNNRMYMRFYHLSRNELTPLELFLSRTPWSNAKPQLLDVIDTYKFHGRRDDIT